LTKKLALALALAVAIFVVLLAAAGWIGTLRLGLLTAACLVLPGLGWARRSQLRDVGDRLALVIGISICAVTVIGTVMAVTGRWSTPVGAAALLAVAAAGFVPHGTLTAISAGLKWFINLFAGPAPYPATQASDDSAAD
jgi:uncharacterized membrane protein